MIAATCLSVCVYVCLSLAACLHYSTYPDVTWGMVGVPPSRVLLGGFAIGAPGFVVMAAYAPKCEMPARTLVLAVSLVLL